MSRSHQEAARVVPATLVPGATSQVDPVGNARRAAAAGHEPTAVDPALAFSDLFELTLADVVRPAIPRALLAGGLTQEQVDRLLASLPHDWAERACEDEVEPCPPEPPTCEGPGVEAYPRSDLPTTRDSQARPLAWDAPPRASLSPLPAPRDADLAAAASLDAHRHAHEAARLEARFGDGADRRAVRLAAQIAREAGHGDVAARLEQHLVRIRQQATLDVLNVEVSERYEKRTDDEGKTSTYCNVYAHDLVVALGAWLPRTWWGEEALGKMRATPPAAVVPEYGETVWERSANGLDTWMRTHGAGFGWAPTTDLDVAQEAANLGLVVVLLAPASKGPGHITVVLAEDPDPKATAGRAKRTDATKLKEGEVPKVEVPLQSQAGTSNSREGTGSQWWGVGKLMDGTAWIHRGSRPHPGFPVLEGP